MKRRFLQLALLSVLLLSILGFLAAPVSACGPAFVGGNAMFLSNAGYGGCGGANFVPSFNTFAMPSFVQQSTFSSFAQPMLVPSFNGFAGGGFVGGGANVNIIGGRRFGFNGGGFGSNFGGFVGGGLGGANVNIINRGGGLFGGGLFGGRRASVIQASAGGLGGGANVNIIRRR